MTQNIRNLSLKNPEIPHILREIPSPPKTLNVWGKIPKTEHYLSVVGTRKNSAYGEEILRKIVAGLSEHNFTIVSGLATGIDAIAHKMALENNMPTIGVLGSGLNYNVFFPKQNWRLAEEIAKNGAVISEYENDKKAEFWTFPQRNRIISGLARATLIVEAGEKSGSLITARFALDQNREVMAIPGTVYSTNSKGTNKLIKQGAHLIESAEDILEIYGINFDPDASGSTKKSDFLVNPRERTVLDAITEPADIDTIIRACKMPSYEVQAIVGFMEIKGIIKNIGGLYIKNF